ncbi:MAG: hypothetical protein A3C93_04165 [Candidatus Lloydbacteria bacterium RIFCSPHIGHO2_02_FULL_54_17]|uniref:Uncharacterized protein n=1 Tax=Candidatus Lloydbacteria bacterium RIFCSPHIGHO2_02_FULL_54_17 TaxID=1798664 RepID=A0A1G2DIH4_9BACT|nr:MAG: hypothetical protein A3C93_04165 [Candidatus Lloydbacteria bacterium RIFCSPHIGHO2_02_FULL_54_17]
MLLGEAVSNWRIRCAKCGDVIGVWPENLREWSGCENVLPLVRCLGQGNHPKPHEVCIASHWGIVEEFYFSYPETGTKERAYRYIGPLWWPLVALAFLAVKQNHGEKFRKLRVGGRTVIWLPRHRSFWKQLKKFCSEPLI